jgi:hypothetical protein
MEYKLLKKVVKKIAVSILSTKGYSEYGAFELTKEIFEDLFKNKQETLKEKLWAYRRGFLAFNIKNYGLTNNNYKGFLSDFDYYRLYPINGEFMKWIDDKLTTRYILSSYQEYLPKYYYHIKKPGVLIALLDSDFESKSNIETIIKLLKKNTNLSLKLLSGTGGAGFYKISYLNNKYYLNNSLVVVEKMISFLSNLENYIVTEYVSTHPEVSRIFSPVTSTVRFMVINEDGQHPIIANSFVRFGTNNTGAVDNMSAGGLYAIVDVSNGKFTNAKRWENYHIIKCEMHPDTQIRVEGVLPHWELIKTKLIEISKYLSELTYMGFDVAITEEGFKIIEINSHQGLKCYQNEYPLLKNNAAASLFKRLITEKAR